ncbi:hypothetical protein BGX38DRAFT_1240046 [Terfezia claveryi]|nr:hypothetical protein BGX38DRAFT_1240046 [Terfezia claveryi]
MKASFRFLTSLVLLLPLLSSVLASTTPSDPGSTTEALTSAEGRESVICHKSHCYPRIFTPTMEWQVIEPDQEIPPGAHIRLNMQTGVRECRVNIPGEGSEYEAVAVELPPNGGSASVVVVGAEEVPIPSSKPPPPNDDPYGAIKIPTTAQSEELPFTDAVSVILDSKSFSDTKLNDALFSLEGLVHEMYWGLQIATPKSVNALLNLVHTSTNPSIRKSAALVIGSALQNNPKALKNAINSGGKIEVRLIETLLVALDNETDDSARLRIMYALSQGIKSNRTYEDFIRINGIRKLLDLFQKAGTDGGEFKGKVSTFVEDNFLNDDMKTELPSQKDRHNPNAPHYKQKPLQPNSNESHSQSLTTIQDVLRFCRPLQEALLNSERNGITGDEVKIKILNALAAMETKYGRGALNCVHLQEFEQWFSGQISGERDVAKLEGAGEWFKIRALEVKDTLVIS